jgi:hypothetical protein
VLENFHDHQRAGLSVTPLSRLRRFDPSLAVDERSLEGCCSNELGAAKTVLPSLPLMSTCCMIARQICFPTVSGHL